MTAFQHVGAFVVQFRADTNFSEGRVAGRVEHVASGQTAHFASARALLEAFERVLSQAPPPQTDD
jgi:hypothetical protein